MERQDVAYAQSIARCKSLHQRNHMNVYYRSIPRIRGLVKVIGLAKMDIIDFAVSKLASLALSPFLA
jgi:hypothetical protein